MRNAANLSGMTTATARNLTKFHEDTRAHFDRIDRDAGVIHGVRVLGLKSRNRRSYLREAIEKAHPLYEGQKVYLNHSTTKRQTKERWGKIVNVRLAEDGGMIADLHYLKNHPETEQLLEAIERFEDIGLSHDSEGLSRREPGGGEAVYEIAVVHSVDVVEKPATTKSFFEDEAPMRKKILEVLREHEAKNETAKDFLTRMTEMEGEEHAPAFGEMEMDAPAEDSDADFAVKGAIRAAIMAILDEDGDASASLTKIKALLKIKDTLKAPESDPVEMAAQESEIIKLRADLQQFKEAEENRKQAEKEAAEKAATENACTKLLEDMKREATPVRLRALCSVPEADRKALVESWSEIRQRPASSPPRYATPEPTTGSYEDVAKRLHEKKQAAKQ